jgi:hypothetical protein
VRGHGWGKLAAKLAKVTERLGVDAPNMERPGAELIAWYLCSGRHALMQELHARKRWHGCRPGMSVAGE